ncbi:hypothetical protein LMG667_23965 [Xanthomonas euvesicatoria]|nr:hypothetical protein LMG667_23965 [Xanthomonas euvesicatoria]OCG93205.1 hypothetical protein LMG933_22070 [Xanthomonas euvesicatoria]
MVEGISVCPDTATQANRIRFRISPRGCLVFPVAILIQPTRRIKPLPRKPHIQHQCRTIPIRILIRRGVAEGFTLQAPCPHCDIAGGVDHHARAAQVIGFDVVQFACVGQQTDW